MEDLDDDLDLRFHRGLKPDVYYRCPTLESLDGALRNELEKNASSLIPVEIVTEFLFAPASTITVPVAQQPALDALIEPADHLQSITVDYALCRDIDGKDRLRVQRAIAKSIIEAVSQADGFKYSERSAQSKEGGDGARFKYVCQDSVQKRIRKSTTKKEKEQNNDDSEDANDQRQAEPVRYDCGGAIHIKFSTKREAINVVYKHNPIHSTAAVDESNLPALAVGTAPTPQLPESKAGNGVKERKRKRSKKDHVHVENDFRDPNLDMSTSPETSKPSAKNKHKKNVTSASPDSGRKTSMKKSKKGTGSAVQKKARVREHSPPPVSIKGRACIRCREKKIKCNEARPTCNQCCRGLWTCQYELPGARKRSKTGCVNCKSRKRKCTEERPSCAYCLRLNDDCQYADYS
ncbi:hypothetical protein BDU57DRAFT_446485 [Ampelomyces quisqualis]|uniref:Zn(2)-C6 fungal-type domain-containing protein n=1 Tax=Ampelomyces quisqualis TaxID=50730 RepID=A0A6A5QP05_AMPQU|nr:hypothetical protein BDU57DRAFT_446485 [Ampelomyces quisqualis]